MALITNAQVVAWDNNRARPICDKIRRLFDALTAYQTDYVSQGINAAITGDAAGSTSVIDDGASPSGAHSGSPDGRNPITGTNIQNLKACIDQIVTAIGTTNVTGVGSPPTTTVNVIQVNGSNLG